MFDYKGRVVMVTGASSGLGQQMAEGFAGQGADLAILARRTDRLEAYAERIRSEYGVEVLPVPCDVTDTDAVNGAVDEIVRKFGKIDVLVNAAGASKAGSVFDSTDEDWDFTIDILQNSVFKVTRAVSQVMMEAKYGRIINIASMYGLMGTQAGPIAYHTAKGAVVNFTRAAAAELAPYNITVNAICPGFFETELTSSTVSNDDFKKWLEFTVPLKRLGNPGELNSGAIFLGAEESSFVTGIALPIDGGWSNAK